MTRIVASAPGKLVVTGEYAVLEGAPAVVLAVGRRAQVVLDSSADADYRIDTPGLGIRAARCRLDADGRAQWLGTTRTDAMRLDLTAAAIEAAGSGGVPTPFCAALDTRAFYAAHGTRTKLGLGSSAALMVALAGAIRAHDHRPAPSASELIAAHRRVQDGRGSGLDIAASLSGGVLVYRWRDEQPQITPARWPAGLEFCCVWSGRSASTTTFLHQLAAWRVREPTRYAAQMRELGAGADAAADALAAGQPAALLQAVVAYAAALARLGAASGLDIVCAEHRAIAVVASRCGVAYKTCGAGGGDIGMALTTDTGRLRDFRQQVAHAGFSVLDVRQASTGLRVHGADRH